MSHTVLSRSQRLQNGSKYIKMYDEQLLNVRKILTKIKKLQAGEFIYCVYAVPQSNEFFNPYNIVETNYSRIAKARQYYTFSKLGVAYWTLGENTFTSLEQWNQEYNAFLRVMRIQSFMEFRLDKGFRVWRKNILTAKFRQAQSYLAERSIIQNPNLAGAVLELQSDLLKMESLELSQVQGTFEWKIENFCDHHQAMVEGISDQLKIFRENTKLRLYNASLKALTDAGFHPIDEILVYPSITKMREVMSFKDKARKRAFCKLLANFLTCCDYMILNFVHKMINKAVAGVRSCFENGLQNETIMHLSIEKPQKKPLFLAKLFLENDAIILEPSESTMTFNIRKLCSLFVSIINSIDPFTGDEFFLRFTEPSIMGRQEESLCDAPPQIMTLLKTDAVHMADTTQIFIIIKYSYEKLNAWVQKLDEERAAYEDDFVTHGADIKSERNICKLRHQMELFYKNLDKLESMNDLVSVALFQLDQKKFKHSITPRFRDLLAIVENKLPRLVSETLEEIEQTLAHIDHKVQAEPESTKEIVRYLKNLDRIQNEYLELFRKVDYAHDTLILMKNFGLDPGFETKELYMDTEDAVIRSKEYFVDKCSRQEELIKKLGEVIALDFAECLKLSEEIESKVENPKYLDILSDDFIIKNELEEYQLELQDYLKKAHELRGYQKEYKLDPISFQKINEVLAAVELRSNLWSDFQEWNEYQDKFMSTELLDMDTDELTEVNTKIFKNLTKYEKFLPPNILQQRLKQSVEEMKTKIPVIGYLRNPNIKARHWNAIEDALERKVFGADDIRMNQLEQCNAFSEDVANRLMLISSQVTGEYQLETMLKSVESIWKETELTLIPHGEASDVYILVDEELVTIMDDTNITLYTILASRFVEHIKSKVLMCIEDMSQFSKTLEQWMDCQFLWLYFETIFASADIQRQLPEEAKLFSLVDRSFKEIARKAKKISLAFPVMTDRKLWAVLIENNTHLNTINKCIESYLEVKRIAFPRLYFLSNDELLDILRQTRNPHAVQVHLPKIFDAVSHLEFGVREYDERNKPVAMTNDIIAMISPEGERLVLGKGLKARGNTEDWLSKVEEAMFLADKRLMKFCFQCFFTKSRIDWFQDHLNQNVLTVSIQQWTADVEEVLIKEKNVMANLKNLQKLFTEYLIDLANLTRKKVDSLLRKVLCALITVDVHNKNCIDILLDTNCVKRSDFNWLKMFRFYWDKSSDTMYSEMASASLPYYYEYIGASGVLVLTPLTDKCYLCLMGAMQMNLGGSPAGPAGTGKTETTKNLAKQLAKQCIVFNCSDGLDYKMMGKFFSGLAQCGAWCCFDEFNRINIEVLSVIAQQLITIQSAKNAIAERFVFEGREIKLIPSCVVFITMNPGYAGRTELPDNLKAMFRPMSMMIPDYKLIAEVILYSEGFEHPQSLAQKMVYMYKLCSEQLSQQSHYDFGMRAVKSVLVMAGTLKRSRPDQNEEITLICALRDSNIAKFLPDDVVLFEGILSDLFPTIHLPVQMNEDLVESLKQVFEKDDKVATKYALIKCLQLFETVVVRWGIMVLGRAASGKSTILNTLVKSITNLAQLEQPAYAPVDIVILNPKAVSSNELYGYVNSMTLEWRDGLLGKMVRDAVNNTEAHFQYIVCDGPVDAEWIENLNSVLDDNKLFCLANSERIKLTPWVRMVFEVEDLAQASPATVSRCGMVYLDESELGWPPMLQAWRFQISSILSEPETSILFELQNKFFNLIMEAANRVEQSVWKQATVSKVKMYCNLMVSLLETLNPRARPEHVKEIITKSFIWCSLWAFASHFSAEAKDKFEIGLRKVLEDNSNTNLPEDSLWNFKIDFVNNSWIHWDSLVQQFQYLPNKKFFELQVPTIDTVRFEFLATLLLKQHQPIMFVGESGVGKSMLAEGMLKTLCNANYVSVLLNFSAKTSSLKTQNGIESKMVKRRKNELDAPPGKKLIVFVDDINMPTPDKYNSQPPIELLRLLVDLGGLYDRDLLIWKKYMNIDIAAACAPPGGGRNPMTSRLTRHFSILQLPKPELITLQKIFGSILDGFFGDFNSAIKNLTFPLINACIETYDITSQRLLPSPEKSHYIFNLRDLSKCVQGLLQSDSSVYQQESQMLRLFAHETTRVFHDRLVNDKDKQLFGSLLRNVCTKNFGISVVRDDEVVLFGDFMIYGQSPKERVYNEISDIRKVEDIMNTYLNELLETQGGTKIVLFREALENTVRIARILRMERGHVLLIGLSGMGKQSLAKLAAFVNLCKCFQINVTNNYNIVNFHDDIRNLYKEGGVQNLPMVFLMADSQIMEEEFLEDIGNILTSGEVENLFEGDALEKLLLDLQQAGFNTSEGRDEAYKAFIARVKDNLHLVLAMSPVGEAFRRRCRMFPALLNFCTLNWFGNWPLEALYSVAHSFMGTIKNLEKISYSKLSDACLFIHQECDLMAQKFLLQTRRRYYITPSSYIGLLKLFEDLLTKKIATIDGQVQRLSNGLNTIFETNKMIAVMQAELENLTPQLDRQAVAMKELVTKLEEDSTAADKVRIAVANDEAAATEMAATCKVIADDAAADLQIAMPALKEAEQALSLLSKADINELKAFSTPPALVKFVMEAVCLLFGAKATWASAKALMADANFVNRLINFDKEHISESTLKKLKKYVEDSNFQPKKIERVSKVAKSVCLWVIAMDKFAKIYKVVEPKIKTRNDANSKLVEITNVLRSKQKELVSIENKMEELRENLKNKTNEFKMVQDSVNLAMARINRASRLATALVEEETRWKGITESLIRSKEEVVGNTIIAAGCVSYLGAFTAEYRKEITARISEHIQSLGLQCMKTFSLGTFLGDSYEVRSWNIGGLPSDSFSIENGIFVTRAMKWPLMIDPQEQANNWIQSLEKSNGLIIVRITEQNPYKKIEKCLQSGAPMLFENVRETLHSVLVPILNKEILLFEGRHLIKFGDKLVEYNTNFKLYMTTKLSNPHFVPEICTRVTLINFQVTSDGLTQQLLAQIVSIEQPKIEQQRNDLIVNIDQDKRQLLALEDKVLKLLSSAGKNILDDEVLVETLNNAKKTSLVTATRIVDAEQIEQTVTENRGKYRTLASFGTVLYAVIARLGDMNSMYQYSLKYFCHIFCNVIKDQADEAALEVRLQKLKHRTLAAIYNKIARSLYSDHKAVFRFLLASAVDIIDQKSSQHEFNFLTGIDRAEEGVAKPAGLLLNQDLWTKCVYIDKYFDAFEGIKSDVMKPFSISIDDVSWTFVLTESNAKEEDLGRWDRRLSNIQKLILIKIFKRESLVAFINGYVNETIGTCIYQNFVVDEFKSAFEDSSSRIPIVFVLSAGSDPMKNFEKLSLAMGIPQENKFCISLGQGQGAIAENMIEHGSKEGDWVFLQNCHLAKSWMNQLEIYTTNICLGYMSTHNNFRLFLSSLPVDYFPVSILQNSIKLTNEQPKGVRNNIQRTLEGIPESFFEHHPLKQKWRSLVFCLCLFHSVIVERKKFGPIGWNICYEFNDSDINCGLKQLEVLLNNEPEHIPWQAIQYINGEVTWGGRVTDYWDQRCLSGLLVHFINPKILEHQPLYDRCLYRDPKKGALVECLEEIKSFPLYDGPEVFGMSENATLAFERQETENFLHLLSSTSSAGSSLDTSGAKKEYFLEVCNRISTTLKTKISKQNGFEGLRNLDERGRPSSLNTVVLQEIDRFNILLSLVHDSVSNIEKAVAGLVVIDEKIEMMMRAIAVNKVPETWSKKSFLSIKSLPNWILDFQLRIDFVQSWLKFGPPASFWLSGFFFPQAFLTAVLQTHSRKYEIPIDLLQLDFHIQSTLIDQLNVFQMRGSSDGHVYRDLCTKDIGVFMHGLFIEAAKWSAEDGGLIDENKGELYSRFPTILLQPCMQVAKGQRYTAPVYKTQERSGTLSTTGHSTNFILSIYAESKQKEEYWILRGAALVSSVQENTF